MRLRRLLTGSGWITITTWSVLAMLTLLLAQARWGEAGSVEAAELGNPATSAATFRVAARGRVESISEELNLAIGVVGMLGAVYVDEGDTIKRGQLLAELVNGDLRARVTEAEAQVSLRKAELDKL